MKRTASQIYAANRAAGFSVANAIVLTAIALAESGGDDTALGDVGLENNTWGASYGLYQVRTLKAQTGTGQTRDISWLAASDANQAAAAFQISRGGQDFSPWTTYTSGRYQQFLGQAQAAAQASPSAAAATLAAAPGMGSSSTASGVRDIAVQAVFVILGVGLVGYGVYRAVAPTVKPLARKAVKAAATAAVL